jgi:hypothetical protein
MKFMERSSTVFVPLMDFLFAPLGGIRKIKADWFACLESWDWKCFSKSTRPSPRHRRRLKHPHHSFHHVR